jgi:hypothetical protein
VRAKLDDGIRAMDLDEWGLEAADREALLGKDRLDRLGDVAPAGGPSTIASRRSCSRALLRTHDPAQAARWRGGLRNLPGLRTRPAWMRRASSSRP